MKNMRTLTLMLAAAAAPLLAAVSSRADTVNYRTYGTFSTTSGDSLSNTATGNYGGTSSIKAASGALTLSFTGLSSATNISLPSTPTTPLGANFDLGSFNLSGLTGAFAGTEQFTIFINQTSPIGGSASSTASVSGTVSVDPATGNPFSRSVVFAFNPTSFTIGNENYTLPSFVGVDTSMATGNDLTANVIGPSASPSTPLPKTAMAGVGLLGLLGLTKIRNKGKLA